MWERFSTRLFTFKQNCSALATLALHCSALAVKFHAGGQQPEHCQWHWQDPDFNAFFVLVRNYVDKESFLIWRQLVILSAIMSVTTVTLHMAAIIPLIYLIAEIKHILPHCQSFLECTLTVENVMGMGTY